MTTGTATRKAAPAEAPDGYVLPVIDARLPTSVAAGAFWAFVGIALAEVIDPPLATIIAVGLLVASRRKRVETST